MPACTHYAAPLMYPPSAPVKAAAIESRYKGMGKTAKFRSARRKTHLVHVCALADLGLELGHANFSGHRQLEIRAVQRLDIYRDGRRGVVHAVSSLYIDIVVRDRSSSSPMAVFVRHLVSRELSFEEEGSGRGATGVPCS